MNLSLCSLRLEWFVYLDNSWKSLTIKVRLLTPISGAIAGDALI
ncbi:hypothetical protein [Nostoc sp.]